MAQTKAQQVTIPVGSQVKITAGQFKDRVGTLVGITEPSMASGFLYLGVVDLPAGIKVSSWTYEGRTTTQQFLVPERKGVRVMPKSFIQVPDENAPAK
jgi:hypothetical protein